MGRFSRTILALVLATSLVPMVLPGASAAYGQYGGLVTVAEPDLVGWLSLDPNATSILFQDVDGDTTLDATDPVFIHFGAGTTILANDIRIAGSSPGKQVRTVAEGQNQPGTAIAGYDIIFQDTLPTGAADGEFNPGEALFLDITADGVTADDIRLSKSGAGVRASSAEAANAAAAPEISLGALPAVLALDADGSGHYNANDVLYFDIDGDEWVSIGDVRLTSFGSLAYGTSPAINDIDTVQVLSAAPSYEILYDDEDGDLTLDLGEAILLDFDADGPDAGDISWSSVSGCAVGSVLTSTTTCGDSNADYIDSGGQLMHTGTAPFDTSEALVVHFGAGSSIAAGDLCLSNCPSSKTPGTKFTAAGAALTAVTGDLAYLDIDADGAYSRLDMVYYDDGTHGAGLVTPGDVRLAAVSSKTFGSMVQAGEADCVHILEAAPSMTLGFLESGSNGGLSSDDPIVLGASNTTAAGDVRLTTGFAAGSKAGSRVSGVDVAQPVTQTLIFATTGSNDYISASDELYVTRDVLSPDDTPGDAIITNGGARVTTASNAVSLTEIAPTLAWLDVDGDGDIDGNDAGYLQFQDDTANPLGVPLVTAGDVRFTGTSTGSTTTPPGTTPTTPGTSTSTSTEDDTSTDSSSNTGTSDTGSTTGDNEPEGPAELNRRIAASLEIEREDGENTLTWDPQDGAEGYQVFSSNSPFVLLTTLFGGGSSSYKDTSGDADTKYLVTAFVSNETKLSAADVNNGQVPGYSGVPSGKDAGSGGSKGFIPGFDLVVVLAAIGLALVAVRRRL